jgi:hypothetical protein
MAPFTFGPCPRCAADTRQRFLFEDDDGHFAFICEVCFAVTTDRQDGTVECRDATDEERAMVPRRVEFTPEQRAEWRESLKQSRIDIRKWLDSGCPGLTPELERAFPPGWLERVRRFTEESDEGR